MTPDPEVLGAFSADDPLEARVGKDEGSPEEFSRESEKSLGEKKTLRSRVVRFISIGPHFLIAKANKDGEFI